MQPQTLEAPAVVEQPQADAGLPPMSEGLRAAFANPQPVDVEPQPQAQPADNNGVVVAANEPAAQTPAAVSTPDYTAYLKETFGVDKPEALKEKLTLAEQAEALKANQRDPHDLAIREMLADPQKAQAYFALQNVQPEALAAGNADQQRQLLFENYKLANPGLNGRLAELGFNKEYQAKYGLMESDDPDEAEDVEFAKLQYQADLQKAVPAVKTAQEAAKIAVLPKKADGPTPEEAQANFDKWLNDVDNAIKSTDKVEQVFQVGGAPVTVVFDAKSTDFKPAMDNPIGYVTDVLNAIAFPNGNDKPADYGALMRAIGRITQPDALVNAGFAAGVASQGAVIPMDRLANPSPDAPQPGANGGEPDRASVLSKMRAASTGRPY